VKIVFASTPDQEEKINELIKRFYRDIFPLYFSDKDIKKFEERNVLNNETAQLDGTLKEAYYLIASLQTLLSILESSHLTYAHQGLFEKNVETLNEYGFYFPFSYNQFIHARETKTSFFSTYTQAANQLLI
jgi:hypothetical protein